MDPAKIRPADKWVVVTPSGENRMVGGLIHLPDYKVNLEKLSQGTGVIVRKGKGRKNDSVAVNVGDTVAYRSYLDILHPIEDSTSFLVHIDDILGVVSPGIEVGVFSRPAMHSVTAEQAKAMKEP